MKRKANVCVWTSIVSGRSVGVWDCEFHTDVTHSLGNIVMWFAWCPFCGRKIKVKESTDGK